MKTSLRLLLLYVVLLSIFCQNGSFSSGEGYEVITLIPGLLNIARSENKGVVFGIFPGKTNAFIVLSAIAIIAIICIYLWSDKSVNKSNIALGFVFGWRCGNLWDRIWFKG